MKKNYFLLLTFFSLFVIQKSFAATSTITASGFTFSPASITIANGDSVNFSIASSHNVVEVSFATWSASGSTPLVGGFSLPYGGGLLTSSTGLTLGTHYYVCTPHAGMGMKGIIIVAAAGPSSYSFGSIGASVCENFTGYTASGFSPSPIAGQLNSNSWAITGLSDGILAFGGTRTTASSDYTRGTTTWGASTTGGLYSITPNENFMVQGTGPDMTNGTITMRIQNATGSALNNFDVVYDLFSKNDQFRSTSINFLYSMDNVTYYQVPSLKYSTIADSTGLVDSVNRSVTLTGFTVGTSAYLYLRWNIKDNGGTGSRDEVAIDNICVTPNTSGSASPALLGAVVINEFVNNNMASSVVNPGGMHSDYIELFNLTPSAIDLGGSSLGNSSTSWYNYTFPAGTSLPASGYLVVWCDMDTSSLGIHTNFTLNNVTGGLSMSNALGRLLDSVSYTGGIADTSFSRIPNGIGLFRNRSLLTPLAINDTFVSVIIPYLSFRTISSSVSEAVSTVTVQVNISSPSSDTTRVDVVLDASSTATSSDFSFTPLTLTFLPSSSDSQTFTVSILNDLVPESNETVKLNLSNATNRARFIDSLHTITIIDDDVLRVYWDTTTMTYDEAAGTLNADVMISAPSALTTSVDVTLIAGSATTGADYTFTPVTVTFPASSTTPQNVSFTIIDDALFEGIENFTLKISNPTNGALIDDSMFTVNIIDNDVLPTGDCSNLFFSEYIEGSSSNKSIEIYNPTSAAINLSGYTLVKYINGASIPSGTRALSGSIAAGDVFVISNNNANTAIILASDDTTGFMNFNGDDALSLNYLTDTLDIIGIIGVDPGTSWTVGAGSTMDHTLIRSAYTYQGNKNWTSAVNEWQSFSIDMTDSLGAHHIMPCGTPMPFKVYWDTTTMTYNEAAGLLNAQVMISAPSALTTSVDVTLIAGSATSGADFTFTPVTVTFPASSTTPQNVSFAIIDDTLFEGIENFTLKISNPTNGALINDSMFTVNIIDNDAIPTGDCSNLFFSEYLEGSSNNKSIEIYNPTSAAINLSGYTLVKYINGASIPSGTLALSGSIAAGDVYVVSNNNANAAIILASDDTTGFMNFNGDDALSLNYLTDTLDIIGIIGVDPGTSWTVGAGSTMDHTLIRSAYTYQGNKNWTSAVNEWQSFSIDMTDSLRAHQIMPCGTPVPPIPPTISVTPILTNISEGSGSTTFNFTVVNPSGTAFSVDVLADAFTSTATAGSDYTYTPTTVNFPVGGVQTVSILEDLLVEGIETITIRLRNPTAGAILIDSVLTINIRDNDSLLVYMQGAGSSVVENVALTTFNVKMNGFSANPTSVDVHYLSGDATPGTDFTYRDTTITFLSGDTLRTLQINVIEDIIDELNEQVIISLSNATNGAKLGTKNYTLVIVDNDSTQIGIADLSAWMNAVKIYPNPVLNTLIIESNEAITSIELYDLSGKLVHRLCDIQNATKVELDFSTYPNGTYIIKSSNGTENYSKSIIKQ